MPKIRCKPTMRTEKNLGCSRCIHSLSLSNFPDKVICLVDGERGGKPVPESFACSRIKTHYDVVLDLNTELLRLADIGENDSVAADVIRDVIDGHYKLLSDKDIVRLEQELIERSNCHG